MAKKDQDDTNKILSALGVLYKTKVGKWISSIVMGGLFIYFPAPEILDVYYHDHLAHEIINVIRTDSTIRSTVNMYIREENVKAAKRGKAKLRNQIAEGTIATNADSAVNLLVAVINSYTEDSAQIAKEIRALRRDRKLVSKYLWGRMEWHKYGTLNSEFVKRDSVTKVHYHKFGDCLFEPFKIESEGIYVFIDDNGKQHKCIWEK